MSAAKQLRNPKIRLIGIRNLVLDETIQSRVGLDKEWARQLSEFRKDGAEFPPIGVVETPDGRFVVWSGFHRVEASRLAGDLLLRCEVEPGTERDARIKSAGSNRSNGVKPMTTKDLRKAAEMLFTDDEWFLASVGSIARHTGASESSVSRWRLLYCRDKGIELPREINTADGKTRGARRAGGSTAPRIVGGGRNSLVVWIGGKKHRLGSDPQSAERRRDDLWVQHQEAESKRVTERHSSLRLPVIRDRLNHTGVYAVMSPNHSMDGLGSCALTETAVIVSLKSSEFGALRDAVCTALFNRAKHRPDGRVVVVCYDPPACEALDIAREKLGIEFMTPEELIENLKPTAE